MDESHCDSARGTTGSFPATVIERALLEAAWAAERLMILAPQMSVGSGSCGLYIAPLGVDISETYVYISYISVCLCFTSSTLERLRDDRIWRSVVMIRISKR